jgi:Sugar-transfer associated ATP-grasp
MGQQRSIGFIQALLQRWHAFFNMRCLAGFPWFWPARPAGVPVMTEARRIVRRYFGRDHHRIYRASAQIFVTVAWPPAVLLHCWQIRRFRGPEAVPIKRIPGAIWTAMRHNVLPGEYFAYKLWEPDRKVNIDNYLYSNEAPRLFKVLNRPLQSDPIGDKLAFHEMCKVHALPTPEILAAFAEKGTLIEFESLLPPERDLFVKPRFGISGHRAERFRWHRAAFESDRGYRIRAEELGGHLAIRAYNEKETLLVQPVLLNHSDLRMNPNEALATARLVTGVSSEGIVVPIFGFIYFAQPNRITAQHGLVALINVANGQLMSTPISGNSGGKRSNLQLDDCSDNAWMLPNWAAALRHAKVAHGACTNFVFVGWDIAFTGEGPMLLEGNANWSADEHQSLTGEPLGHRKFAEILEGRLKSLVNR